MVSDVWKNGQRVVHTQGSFTCMMLFRANWPKLPSYGQLNIPDGMLVIRNKFEDAELERYPFKEIEWVSDLGICKVDIGGVLHTLT